ncbi:WYL domain-containing protein [Gulosibacter chungangensis]|nr:WYL domain-containing protein [Gulosibacter chungangensis]
MAESTKVDPVLVTSVLDYLRRSEHGYDLDEMAEHFGLPATRMIGIIDFLWTLEFPDSSLNGHEHMFDFDADGLAAEDPWVKLTHDPAAKVTRRFQPQELATVLTGLSTLRDFRNPEETEILDRLTAKLLGQEASDSVAEKIEAPVVAAMRRALDRSTQLQFSYFREFADAPETRTVDPLRIEVRGAMVYLLAYCHLREGMRWFRHDRILTFTELDEPIGQYSEQDRNQPLQVRGQGLQRVDAAIAPCVFAALRPYLDARDFPPLDSDGFSRCSIVFRSLHVAARLAAENAGAFMIEGPAEARSFMVRWAQEALSGGSTLSSPKA